MSVEAIKEDGMQRAQLGDADYDITSLRDLDNLPVDGETEGILLALALFYPKQYAALLAEVAQADDFFMPNHRQVHDAIRYLVEEGKVVEPSTVWATIMTGPFPPKLANLKELIDFRGYLPREHSPQLVRELVEKLRPLGVKRRIDRSCKMIASQARDKYDSAQDILAQWELELEYVQSLMGSMETHNRKGFIFVDELAEEFDARQVGLHEGRTDAIPTGLPELDDMLALGGLKPKGVYVIAATPGIGKTSVALGIVQNLAIRGIPTGFSTLEMDRLDILQRAYSRYSSVPYWMWRPGFHGEEYRRARQMLVDFRKLPLAIDDTALTFPQFRRATRNFVQSKKGRVVVRDYIQMMSQGSSRYMTEYETVTENSKGGKRLAQELHIPLIDLSQLNRDSRREDRQPELHDLRSTGQIEQDAELVAAMWERPEHRENNWRRDNPVKDVEMIVLKQRNGPTGPIMLKYIKEFMTFMTLSQWDALQQKLRGPQPKDEGEFWK